MTHCDRVDALLSAYIEQDTSPAETRFVDGHLTLCPRCRQQLDEMRTLLARLSQLPRVETSADFTERVIARTTGLEPAGLEEPVLIELPSRRPVWAVPLAAAAALALVIVTVTRLTVGTAPSPETAQTPSPSAPTLVQVSQPEVDGPPEVTDLTNLHPELKKEGEGVSIGMVRDSYVLDAYELREPAGGGNLTLTRVSAEPGTRVVVTF
jgi:anti-sigma factor RsiW